MQITDGKKTIDIEMKIWNGSGYDPDWSRDFFEGLEYNEDEDTYIAENVDDCVSAANAWAAGEGDYSDDTFSDVSDRFVFVYEV